MLGVPVVLGPGGWTRVLLDDLPDDEARRLAHAADGVGRMVTASTVREGSDASAAPAATGDPMPSGRAGAEAAWVATVHGLDQPGTLTALTGVFSTRGVSFDSLATEPVDDDGRAGRIVVTFRATPRRTRALERAVRRLATVRSVVVEPAPGAEFSQGGTAR